MIHDNAGKTPVWNHTFEIDIGSVHDDMQFFCKDNDVVGAKEIGSTIIKASSFCINNGVRDWFTITYQNQDAGQILIESKFTPNGAGTGAAVAGKVGVAVQPAMVPVMPANTVPVHPPGMQFVPGQQPPGYP